jgi:hypothetical protein
VPQIKEVNAFDTEANEWRAYFDWSPKAATNTPIHLLPEGKLSFTAPTRNLTSTFEFGAATDTEGMLIEQREPWLIGIPHFHRNVRIEATERIPYTSACADETNRRLM